MLVIENLKKSYDGVEAVKDISFSVGDGDIYGFLGPNGAGKTTLIKLLFNLINPDQGNIKWNGSHKNFIENIVKRSALINNNDRSFFWRLSVLDNLKFFCRTYFRQ